MTSSTPKIKGPASAPTLPDHGSNPTKDIKNMKEDSTPAAVQATVPYPSQAPIDEIDEVLGRLRVLHAALTADSQMLSECRSVDAAMVIDEVLDSLDPIRTFLAKNEFSKVEKPFLECRRAWYARKGGAA